MSDKPNSQDEPAPKRRRRRPALSCEQCRRRKMKCDRGDPCIQCVQARNRECTYSNSSPASTATITSLDTQPHIATAARFFADAQSSSNHHTPNSPSNSTTQARPKTPTSWGSFPSSQKPIENPGKGFGGTFSKTRLFGQSHWMHSFGRFNSIVTLRENPVLNSATFKDEWSKTEIMALIRRCKTVAKSDKIEVHNEWLMAPGLKTLVPSREVSDALTSLYFATGESIYRILHRPTFQKEYSKYWDDPSSTSDYFILKMLLAMANASHFYQGSDTDSIRSQAKKWIFAGQHWLSELPSEKSRLSISGLQIHCLLILARQAHGVVGDLAWVSIGNLVRSGFNMGLQRDPKFFPKMSQMQGEMRRRLWITILEINVQLSLDMGMNPLIAADDFDTRPPSNFDDEDLDDSSTELTSPKSDLVFTQTTIQRALAESLPLRIHTCKLINSFIVDVSYETILDLGGKLTKACKEATSRTDGSPNKSSRQKMTQLQRNLLDMSIRRFLFLLHGNFCVKAFTDPRYYFSRKVCLDSAIYMITYPTSEDGKSVAAIDRHPRDQYTLMKIFAADFFKRIMIHSSMTIFHEMLQQIEDDADSPAVIKEQGRRNREPLKTLLSEVVELTAARIPFDVTNAKAHLFLSAVTGQLEAFEEGRSPDMGAVEGARRSARICLSILDSRRSDFTPAGHQNNEHGSGLGQGHNFSAILEQDTVNQFSMDEWNVDWESPDSWMFAGWEGDKSW